MGPRLHVIALPHTQTTRRFLTCAYTQKVVKFCDMMSETHEVVLYSGDENEARCSEHVSLFTEEERVATFGEWDPNGLFAQIEWAPDLDYWRKFNARAIVALLDRAEREDFLCLTAGWSQNPIAAAIPELLPVEWAVGYEGIHFPHRIFESYAWMHHVYGLRQIKNGAAFDTVIPNFFDPADFVTEARRGDDLLFIGRLVARKGLEEAVAIAGRVGRKLIVAGPGATAASSPSDHGPGRIVCPELTVEGNLEYVGPVGVEERAELLARAAAVLVPTRYIEPFGGVAAEAMMCGTPVVTTDWGAFTEYVTPDVGRRFRTLAEGAAAVEEAVGLEGDGVREYAEARFGLDAVRPQFARHFERLATLWRAGWYT